MSSATCALTFTVCPTVARLPTVGEMMVTDGAEFSMTFINFEGASATPPLLLCTLADKAKEVCAVAISGASTSRDHISNRTLEFGSVGLLRCSRVGKKLSPIFLPSAKNSTSDIPLL